MQRLVRAIAHLLWLVPLAACSEVPSTSLAGSTPCATTSCGPGELCKIAYSGAPDAGNLISCIVVPSGCHVFDCTGKACPACVAAACSGNPDLYDLIQIEGRTLSCPGQ
jgi:hypothetical protein